MLVQIKASTGIKTSPHKRKLADRRVFERRLVFIAHNYIAAPLYECRNIVQRIRTCRHVWGVSLDWFAWANGDFYSQCEIYISRVCRASIDRILIDRYYENIENKLLASWCHFPRKMSPQLDSCSFTRIHERWIVSRQHPLGISETSVFRDVYLILHICEYIFAIYYNNYSPFHYCHIIMIILIILITIIIAIVVVVLLLIITIIIITYDRVYFLCLSSSSYV